MHELPEKALHHLIKEFGNESVLLCFSSGLDSGVLSFLLKKSGIRTVLFYARSPIRPRKSFLQALRFADMLGLRLIVRNTDEYLDESFRSRPDIRCYICKKTLFGLAKEEAYKAGTSLVLDGTNADDLNDIRPGLKALKEAGVRSPFVELGFGKKEIKTIKDIYQLPLPDEPTTCLATRFISSGYPLNESMFPYILEIEDQLKSAGFSNVRARIKEEEIILQVNHDEIEDLKKIKKMLKYPVGYILTVDDKGYTPAGMIMTSKKSR
jgi:uncharacterized protein